MEFYKLQENCLQFILEISKNPNLNLYQCICAMEKERKKEKVHIKQKTIFDA